MSGNEVIVCGYCPCCGTFAAVVGTQYEPAPRGVTVHTADDGSSYWYKPFALRPDSDRVCPHCDEPTMEGALCTRCGWEAS